LNSLVKGVLKMVIISFFLAVHEFYLKPFIIVFFANQNVYGFPATFLSYVVSLVAAFIVATVVVNSIGGRGK
jgi:uncharacterized membrane protein